jgi:hypothetical protein
MSGTEMPQGRCEKSERSGEPYPPSDPFDPVARKKRQAADAITCAVFNAVNGKKAQEPRGVTEYETL